jgi:phosphohistidine phosphatase SixA
MPMRSESSLFFRLILSWVLLCCSLGVHANDRADNLADRLADKLRSPGYLLLMRHAYAPGVGDPVGYRLDNCATQRNLDAQGLAQAIRTGAWLKRQGVDKALVYPSIWCRCHDTAKALELGSVGIEPSLASFFDQPEQAGASTSEMARFIARTMKGKGDRVLILVTHHVNIRAFAGPDIGSGDMVLVKVDAQGRATTHVRYPSPP